MSVRRILSACEKTPRKQDKSRDLSFFKNTGLFWECVLAPLLGVVDRTGFTSDYSSSQTGQPAIAICLNASTEIHGLPYAEIVYLFTHRTLLKPQRINCPEAPDKVGRCI